MTEQQSQWGHRLATWAATGFGAGKAPVAPGTVGTLVGIPIYLLMALLPAPLYALGVAILFVAGVWWCEIAERALGEADHSSIVWDEIVGFLITLFLVPHAWNWVVIGFVLFRIFDIWKPFPIRHAEQLRGGFGVMMDDAVAGVYACLVLHAIVWLGSYY